MMLTDKQQEYVNRSEFLLVHRETDEVKAVGNEVVEDKYLAMLPDLFARENKIVLCGRYTAEGAVTCRAVELPLGFAVIAITYPSAVARQDAVYRDDGERVVSELWDLWDNCSA